MPPSNRNIIYGLSSEMLQKLKNPILANIHLTDVPPTQGKFTLLFSLQFLCSKPYHQTGSPN